MHDFDDILAANRAYAGTFALADLQAPAARHLAVVTCIDSRIEPLPMLGLEPGDAKILRNAGARVTGDVVRSLVLATALLDVQRIMVVQHTDCAVVSRTDDELLDALGSALPAAELADFTPGGTTDARATLAADVARLRAEPRLAPATAIGGFVYDVRTGLLAPADD